MRHANKLLGAIAAVVGAAILYFAVYLAMVIPHSDGIGPNYTTILDEYEFCFRSTASYRFGGLPLHWFFAPVNEIDRKLRPAVWKFDPFRNMPPGSAS